MREVDVDKFLDSFQGIKRYLKKGNFCKLKYDFESGKVLNMVQRRMFKGPYNEEVISQVVDNLIVEEDDIFSSFMSLNQRITNNEFANEKEKRKLKVKEM